MGDLLGERAELVYVHTGESVRIENAWPGRPQYYDRNPAHVPQFGWSIQAGGAGLITLVAYTVPANRLAFIASCDLILLRTGLAATVADVHFGLTFVRGGIDQGNILEIVMVDNLGQRTYERTSALNMIITGGDGIKIGLQDFSAGGTVYYKFGVYIVEFDN